METSANSGPPAEPLCGAVSYHATRPGKCCKKRFPGRLISQCRVFLTALPIFSMGSWAFLTWVFSWALFCPPAFAVDLTLGGAGEPITGDPSVAKHCGPKARSLALRVTLQPRRNFGDGRNDLPKQEVVLLSEDADGPRLTLLSAKFLSHVRRNRVRVVTVVFIEEGKVLDKDSVLEMKPCLLDGKSMAYWNVQ